jgi:hypothetical protein
MKRRGRSNRPARRSSRKAKRGVDRREKVPFVESSITTGPPSGTEYKIPFVRETHPTPSRRPGMDFRTSERSFQSLKPERSVFAVPYFAASGKASNRTLYHWRAHPQQVFFSMLATIHSRVSSLVSKRFVKRTRQLFDACFKVSALYAITHDDYILDRFLGMCRPCTPMKSVHGFLTFCVSQLDANNRFVYCHAMYQAKWLQFRVSSPRDKSRASRWVEDHIRPNDWTDISTPGDVLESWKAFANCMQFMKVTKIQCSGVTAISRSGSSLGMSSFSSETSWND